MEESKVENYLLELEQDDYSLVELGRCGTLKEIDELIEKFLKETNFKSYYQRSREMDKKIWIDYGNHVCFLYISRLDGEKLTLEEYRKETRDEEGEI